MNGVAPGDGSDLVGDTGPPVIFVLGMHRSGTSCLMACLETCGVEVGNVQRFSVKQPRGNLEQSSVIAIDDRLLAAAGGTWRDPPTGRIEATGDDRRAMTEILAALRTSGPGAVKDPRLLITIDAWLATGVPHELIGTFRHPAAVAASLRERDGMSAQAAFSLWRHYNERLVALHRIGGFPLVEFDLSDHEAYCGVVADVAASCALTPRIASIAAVVERVGARRGPDPAGPVPDECAELYDYLRAHRHRLTAADGEDVRRWSPASARATSRRQALVRRMWITTRRVPRPVRTLLRPFERTALRLLHLLPSRR